MTTRSAVETLQDTPGLHRNTPGHLNGFTDLADTHKLVLRIKIFLMDAYDYKRGKAQVASKIESRCQYGQTGQKSCTTSTLTFRNGEAVTHHFSYDRDVEKQMGSASYKTEKTQNM